MQNNDEIGTGTMSDEQRKLFEERLQQADEASAKLVEEFSDDEAQKLVDEYADDPDLKFVANPSLIGDGINVIDNTEGLDSSVMPRQQLTPKQIRHIKRMMAGPMMRENQPCKKCVTKDSRTKKRRMQKLSRKKNRRA